LFAEWLRRELDRSEPGLAAQLHRRASAWHREHGSITDAVEHAVRANLASGPGGVPDLVEPLTCREREVLDLLAEGKPNRGIADELVVTLDTVKRHVSHILAKLGAVNRTEAVARARERNLIH
jgi:ATP/maltotriose-dependent transcriptional regulator MalT